VGQRKEKSATKSSITFNFNETNDSNAVAYAHAHSIIKRRKPGKHDAKLFSTHVQCSKEKKRNTPTYPAGLVPPK